MDALPRELIAQVVALINPQSHAAARKLPKPWRTEFKDSYRKRQDITVVVLLDRHSREFSLEVQHNHPVLRPARAWNYTLRITDIKEATGAPLPPSIRAFLNLKNGETKFDFYHIERFIRLIDFAREFHLEIFDLKGSYPMTKEIISRLPTVLPSSLTIRHADVQLEPSFDSYLQRNKFKKNILDLQHFEMSGGALCIAFFHSYEEVGELVEKFLDRKQPLNLKEGRMTVPISLKGERDMRRIKEFMKQSKNSAIRVVIHPKYREEELRMELIEEFSILRVELVKKKRNLLRRLFCRD